MLEGLLTRRLSGKLLLMTIGFVMLAELLIFVPSAMTFYQDWLGERTQQAGLLTQALTGVPNYEASEILTHQFMEDTNVIMVSARRDGMSEFVLGTPPDAPVADIIDMRDDRRVPKFKYVFEAFFGSADGFIRVLTMSPVEGQDALELIIPKAELKLAMWDYFRRIVYLSLLIAVMTGVLIYVSMSALIIRPVENLAKDLSAFRNNPQVKRGNKPQGYRKDEIGQLQREFYDMKQDVRASFKQRERLATLGLAMAKVNHDLRNVLTSASLVSDRLASDADERVAKMGERLTRAIDRGVKLTRDVLNFSSTGSERAELTTVRLSTLLGEVAGDTLGNFGVGPRKIDFINNVSSEVRVTADSDFTYRIFQNLFRNAAQAMAGMRDDAAKRELTVESDIRGDQLCVSVIDTGPGIPKKVKESLFAAFSSGSGHGSTGLGLTISKELSETQGGELSLLRSTENGTTFEVMLNLAV